MTEKIPICVTGGAGYIGSHTCKALERAGFSPFVIDNLSTGNGDSVRWGTLFRIDLRDNVRLTDLLQRMRPAAILHFAAKAYVGESMVMPLAYYDNNVGGTLSLVRAATAAGVSAMVFSSTCAVYGIPPSLPINEDMPTNPINAYGETKLACERLMHWAEREGGPRFVALRYFNAAGADPDGEIGEVHEPETHIIPLALRAAAGLNEALDILGDDYPTPDGTAIRDYIHVSDLAEAHVSALRYLLAGGRSAALNLGTGGGFSVRQILGVVSAVVGREPLIRVAARRPGDPPALTADAGRAEKILGWTPRHSTIEEIVKTAWAWERSRMNIR